MPRRTILAIPLPADIEDVLQVLGDVGRGWAAGRIENGGDMLNITASRRRAQRPAPDEEPEDYEAATLTFPPGEIVVDNGSYRPIATSTLLRGSVSSPNVVSHARDTEPEAEASPESGGHPPDLVPPENPGAWLDDAPRYDATIGAGS